MHLSGSNNVTRRQYLNGLGIGGLGLGGIALSSILNPAQLAATEIPKKIPKTKNVILLFMMGGASHLETFDFKPQLKRHSGKLARDLFTDDELKGFNPEKDFSKSRMLTPVFPFQRHGQSGQWVSEIFPEVAKVIDEITIIKSMHAGSPIHSVGQLLMHTGFNRPGFPSMGSWVNYGIGSENKDMPGFVALVDGRSDNSSGGTAMYHSGFLPGEYQATVVETSKNYQPPIPYLQSSIRLNQQQQNKELQLINQLNQIHQEKNKSQPELNARIAAFEKAFKMQAQAPQLFDIRRESEATRKLYGESTFGESCLRARRLVEQGVRFVEVFDGTSGRRWDAHGNRGGLIQNHKSNAARTDKAIAGLILDLKSRGLLDETLVVWGTEFGRTPFEEERATQGKLGRGHHHYGFSMWMAGGGTKGGTSYGETDEFGMHAIQDRVSHYDLHATILHLLGIDHKELTYKHNGRQFRLTDVEGRVINEIIA
ncbi:MAG: DUF1501 domain-containing protein [Planctomycetota bacterium]|nr:DUF1501 domain-containing protein [Planctomycetota bacterium]